MKNKSYLENIDHMIEECRARLAKLITAREIVVEIAGISKEAPAVEEPAPFLTLKRTAPAKPNTERRVQVKAAQELQDWLKAELGAKPQTSTDLIQSRYGGNPDKAAKQLIYAGLYYMQQKGMVTRGPDRTYTIVAGADQTAH